eukprot:6027898-Pleurochrysis_carterae.AAC.10
MAWSSLCCGAYISRYQSCPGASAWAIAPSKFVFAMVPQAAGPFYWLWSRRLGQSGEMDILRAKAVALMLPRPCRSVLLRTLLSYSFARHRVRLTLHDAPCARAHVLDGAWTRRATTTSPWTTASRAAPRMSRRAVRARATSNTGEVRRSRV